MKAVTIESSRLKIAERPTPSPEPGQVLIKVRSAGLNAADLLQVRGLYPPPPGVPADIPGLEFCGEIVQCSGDCGELRPGQLVMGLVAGGAQAEYVVAPAATVVPVPSALSAEQAGAVMEAFVTAHDALVTAGGLASSKKVLITGAAGGVGTAAVQIAKHLGAHVTATTRHEQHFQALRDLGAEEVGPPGFEEDRAPFDVILELVGGEEVGEHVRLLNRGGRIVVIGIPAGSRTTLSLAELMGKMGALSGRTLRSRSNEEKKSAIEAFLADCGSPLEKGDMAPIISATFPLDKAEAAYGTFAQGGKLGKIVLVMG